MTAPDPAGYVAGDQVIIVGTEYHGETGTVRGRTDPTSPTQGVWVHVPSIDKALIFTGFQIRLVSRPAPAEALAQLRAENERLQSQVRALLSALSDQEALRARIKASPPPPHTDYWHQAIWEAQNKVDRARAALEPQ